MPSRNVQLVRSIYDRWERGEFTSVDWAHPEIRYSPFDDFSVRETYDHRANVFEIRDGKLVRLFLYADREKARRDLEGRAG